MEDIKPSTAIAAARATEILAGKSPRQRGEEKRDQALEWLYKWGWSSSSILDSLAGIKGKGLSSRLIRNNLIKQTKTKSGGGVKGIPVYMLTLTKTGLELIERERDILLPYNTDPYLINQHLLRHDHIAQEITNIVLLSKSIASFQTEKEFSAFSEKNIKQPDIIWIQPNGKKIAIEIELSKKWGRDLYHFIHSCLLLIDSKSCTEICVVSDSNAIIEGYKKAFAPGAEYDIYEKISGKWKITGTTEVPEWIKGKIIWKPIEN
jgi:hypothetical protein